MSSPGRRAQGPDRPGADPGADRTRGAARPARAPDQACARCGRPRPVELQMTVHRGRTVTLLSCTACDTRTWLVDGEPSTLHAVLRTASADESFELTPSVKRQPVKRARPGPTR